jgi:hypothetical protein
MPLKPLAPPWLPSLSSDIHLEISRSNDTPENVKAIRSDTDNLREAQSLILSSVGASDEQTENSTGLSSYRSQHFSRCSMPEPPSLSKQFPE